MIKRVLGLALAGIIAVGVTASFAGSGCCMGGAKTGACTDSFSKLNLTDHQKTELATLQQDCKNAASTSEAHQMFAAGLENILTPAQWTQWNAQKAAAKDSGCPYMKAHADSKS